MVNRASLGPQQGRFGAQKETVSSALFFFYCLYLVDFFLHLTSRVPELGAIRFTALTFVITWLLVLVNKSVIDKRQTHEVTKALNILLIYLALTFILTTYPGSTLNKYLNYFLKAISFFYFTVICVDNRSRFNKTIALFVGLQLFRAFEPLYLNITEGYWGDRTYIGGGFAQRLAGSPHDIINPNELGFVIVTAMPLIYFVFFEKRGLLQKAIASVVFLLLGYTLILTMSRGAFLTLCVVAWFVLKRSKNKAFLITLIIGGVLAALSVMNDVQRERYLSIFGKSTIEASNATASGRIDGMLGEFVIGFTTRPIFGNGVGTTPEVKYHNGHGAQASHNFYAELLIEIGLFGAFFFYKFIKRLFESAKALLASREREEELRYANAMYVMFIMYAVYSLNYYGLSQSYWYLLAGLVVAFSRIYKGSEQSEELPKGR